ncbi:MAG: hypothetical protein M3P18_26825 [Actinomycetota bacterium]|nr:hypothetical protein [Actinomycetota bacterium]
MPDQEHAVSGESFDLLGDLIYAIPAEHDTLGELLVYERGESLRSRLQL